MKVLVTGREGQLVRSLAARANQYPGLTLQTLGRPELDLERPATILAALDAVRPDVVINAAAYTAVDQAEDDAERAFAVNGKGAGLLAEAARTVGARVVQISTDYVFDGSSEAPYAEDAATGPIGVYGRSKLDGEERVRAATPDHVIVRTAWVYSPFGKNFVRTMMTAARTRDEVSVVDDQRGSPSSALDLADGLLAMVQAWRDGSNRGIGQVYHLAGAGSASWFDVAVATFEECAHIGHAAATVRPIATQDWPTRAQRPKNSTLDCTRFRDAFGYAAPDWRESLKTVVGQIAASGAH